jgi:hypothetical protein
LYANIAIENEASLRLFTKFGFVNCGIKKEWNLVNGNYKDESLFQLINNQEYDNKIINGGFDVDRNFNLTELKANTVQSEAWYTILISTAFTLSQYQSLIGIGINQKDTLTPVGMNSDYYNFTFNFGLYGAQTFSKSAFRIYTTYPSNEMILNNSGNTLYFKGLGLTS